MKNALVSDAGSHTDGRLTYVVSIQGVFYFQKNAYETADGIAVPMS